MQFGTSISWQDEYRQGSGVGVCSMVVRWLQPLILPRNIKEAEPSWSVFNNSNNQIMREKSMAHWMEWS